jgi:hypothetical protein
LALSAIENQNLMKYMDQRKCKNFGGTSWLQC